MEKLDKFLLNNSSITQDEREAIIEFLSTVENKDKLSTSGVYDNFQILLEDELVNISLRLNSSNCNICQGIKGSGSYYNYCPECGRNLKTI